MQRRLIFRSFAGLKKNGRNLLMDRLLKVILLSGKIVIGLLVAYSVIFSIAGTIFLISAYKTVVQPIRDVQYLVQHNPAQSVFMKQLRQEMKKKGKAETLYQVFVPDDSISKNLKLAVIAAEDDGFYTHPGFDIEAMLNAYQYNRQHNRNARGASTITQQLAKNLFLSNEKNFTRKFKELGYTLLLEKFLGKDRILELYLNYAQWGDSIFGCEAAARCYFKKSCARLTLSEATRLAATLVSPERLNPLNAKNLFLQKRIEVIANNLFLKHSIDDSAFMQMCGKSPPRDTLADSLSAATRQSVVPSPSPSAKFIAKAPHSNIATKRGHRY